MTTEDLIKVCIQQGFNYQENFVAARPDYYCNGYTKSLEQYNGGNYGKLDKIVVIQFNDDRTIEINELLYFGDFSANHKVLFNDRINDVEEFQELIKAIK